MAIISSSQLFKDVCWKRCHAALHISISHRSYLSNDGGIEHCLRREVALAGRANVDYLHLCPLAPAAQRLCVSSMLEVTLNDEFVGITNLDGFAAKLYSLKPIISFLHSALGFESDSLLRLLLTLKHCGPIVQWLHDLSFACESVTLVRNGIACGIPVLGADSCHQCKFDGGRAAVAAYYDQLACFSDCQVFPSLTAKLRYNLSLSARGRRNLLRQFVVPHYVANFSSTAPDRCSSHQADKPVGVAFFGHSVPHKGWTEFIQLVDALYGISAYRFYHVGSAHQGDLRVERHNFTETLGAVGGDSLRDICVIHNIKIAFFWPIALESFGLMFRQVLDAGCAIVSSYNNDAQKEFINDCRQIRYFSQFDKLIAWFGNREDVAALLRQAEQSTCRLVPSQCSYELLDNQNGVWQLSRQSNAS